MYSNTLPDTALSQEVLLAAVALGEGLGVIQVVGV